MTLLALGLVLLSAILHATWNLAAKRARGGVAFTWLFSAIGATLYLPAAIITVIVVQPSFTPVIIGFMLGSAVLHTAYFLILQRGYQVGDLSLVYPLARGTGPVLSTTAAILFLGERPTGLAVAGALVIGVSVIILTGGNARRVTTVRTAVVYGLVTGCFIAAYTIWDKLAVSAFLIPPILYDWGTGAGRTIILSPLAWKQRAVVAETWRTYRREAITVGLLSPLAYMLVLTALVFTPVSYIAPAREISILFGTVMGTRLLAEGDGHRRLVAAGGMVLGVIALALG